MSNYPLEWGTDADSAAPAASDATSPTTPTGRYPLEWGWHVPPDPPAVPDNAKLWPTLLGVGDNDAILAASTPTFAVSVSTSRDKAGLDDIQKVALPPEPPANDNDICQHASGTAMSQMRWRNLSPNEQLQWMEQNQRSRDECWRTMERGFSPRGGSFVEFPGGGVVIFRPDRGATYVQPTIR